MGCRISREQLPAHGLVMDGGRISMSGRELERHGCVMEPAADDPLEAEGVLNPAAVRSSDGTLYLFPRIVAHSNYSRIGIARVRFDFAGNPIGVERLGIVLEPVAAYERSVDGIGGCEDPRVCFVEPLECYVMSYTALSVRGPRIALAISDDLFRWERLGPVLFKTPDGDLMDDVEDKDFCIFPAAVTGHDGKPALAILHRPSTRLPTADSAPDYGTEDERQSIWISYCSIPSIKGRRVEPFTFTHHQRLASPVQSWERVKIGTGTPPVLTRLGWLLVYHGVTDEGAGDGSGTRYSAGVMLLDRDDPRIIRFRSHSPVLRPELEEERSGTVANVVFPTGIDARQDLGQPDLFDVYYGMADKRIGVARLDLSRLADALYDTQISSDRTDAPILTTR